MPRKRKTSEEIMAEIELRNVKARARAQLLKLEEAYKEGQVENPDAFKHMMNAYKKLKSAHVALRQVDGSQDLADALDVKAQEFHKALKDMIVNHEAAQESASE